MSDTFTPKEQRALHEAVAKGEGPPSCPRCGSALEVTRMPSPEAVSYVRRRVLFRCSSCRGRAVVDRR